MDLISELPDALLLKILALLPTEDVVATMVLSKRWQFLWTLVPKLVYDDNRYKNIEYGKFSRFVDRSLALHEAPVLETLRFKLVGKSGVVDIGIWIRIAVKRFVRELVVEIDCSSNVSPVVLPRSLYMGCTMLVTLKLNNISLADVPSLGFFQSLKTLSLLNVTYPGGDEFVKRLLSNCPVLEDLIVEQCEDDNVTVFNVRVPSLKRLVLHPLIGRYSDDEVYGFVIDAPSLEYLDICDVNGEFCIIENYMPTIVTAKLELSYSVTGKILGSITSVKRLDLCLETSEYACPVGSVFPRLVHLKMCTCEEEWLKILMCLLRDSPKLQSLKLDLFCPVNLSQCHGRWVNEPRPCWNEPSSIPKCLLSSLETLEWVEYEGAIEEKEVVAFILRNGSCLKKVIISSKSIDPNEKLEMIKKLALSPRRSPTCQLIFD